MLLLFANRNDLFFIVINDEDRVSVYCSGVTAGGGVGMGIRVPPWHFSLGNFCWPTGKREARRKRENAEEKKENWKRKGGKLKMEGRRVTIQNEERTFFFFLLLTFQKPLKFVLGLPNTKMGIFYREKAFYAGKKSGKMTWPPLKNIPLKPLVYCTDVKISADRNFGFNSWGEFSWELSPKRVQMLGDVNLYIYRNSSK